MKSKRIIWILLALGLSLIVASCDSLPSPGAGQEPTVAPAAEVVEFKPIVSATGKVVPEQEASLSVSAGGVVEDVMVSKGEEVTAGQVLVRLEGTEQQLAAISAAELELENAKFALQQLSKDTDLMAAQALQSAESAERALEDLQNTELQIALA